jgi:hypothetical protein
MHPSCSSKQVLSMRFDSELESGEPEILEIGTGP